MKSVISFRLRKQLDADLIDAISKMGETELKELDDLSRDGLRLMLGIRTTKRIEITEKTLFLPARHLETAPEMAQQQEPQRTPLRESEINKKAPANNAGTAWIAPPGRK